MSSRYWRLHPYVKSKKLRLSFSNLWMSSSLILHLQIDA